MTLGIDVSAWQGNIDFDKVKKAGYNYVILKAGGNDDGYYIDSRFASNYAKAKKAGLKVGAYYFVARHFCATNAKKLQMFFTISLKTKPLIYHCLLMLRQHRQQQKQQ